MLSLLLLGFILYFLWAKYNYLLVACPEADASAKCFHLEIHYHLFSLLSGLVNDRMNPAASLFRRLNIRDLVSRTPTYSASSGMYFVVLFHEASCHDLRQFSLKTAHISMVVTVVFQNR